MGWYGNYDSRKDIAAELLIDKEWPSGEGRVTGIRQISHVYRGNVIWGLFERYTKKDDTVTDSFKHIICILCTRHKDGWHYKDMTVECGPCYYSCPMSYVNSLTENDKLHLGENGLEWYNFMLEKIVNKKANKHLCDNLVAL